MEVKKPVARHKLIIEHREKVQVSGVTDVISFDEDCVICQTELGTATFKGASLRVSSLNVDTGDLNLEGSIDSVTYENGGVRKSKSSMLGKIFK